MTTDLKRTVEALLFASPESLSVERLQAIIPRSNRRALREVIAELMRDYDEGGHAFRLTEIAGGWRIQTRPEYTRHIESLLKGQRRVRLSRAALEVLAVVAYRQPCTRTDVEDVRGVNCGGPLATLLERGLVRITGRAESLGRPLLYGTTSEFLSHLGLNELGDLPQLAEIETLFAAGEEGEAESAVACEEKRARLVSGMETVAEIMGSLDEDEQGNGNGNGDGSGEPIAAQTLVAEGGEDIVAESAQDDDAEVADLAEHMRLLQESYVKERSTLEAEAQLEDGDGESPAEGEAELETEAGEGQPEPLPAKLPSPKES